MAFTGSAPALAALLKKHRDDAVFAATGVAPASTPLRDAMNLADAQAIMEWVLLSGVAAVLGTSAPGGGPVVSTIT